MPGLGQPTWMPLSLTYSAKNDAFSGQDRLVLKTAVTFVEKTSLTWILGRNPILCT
jgi:hypothetical protein